MTTSLFTHRDASSLAVCLLIGLLAAGGCTSDENSADTGTSLDAVVDDSGAVDATDSASAAADVALSASLFDTRYCEVLLVKLEGDAATIEVYNTIGLNLCPATLWDAIDAEQLKQQHMVVAVILNGPRYWTIDAVVHGSSVLGQIVTFSGIAMRKVAVIKLTLAELLQMQSSSKPYSSVTVDRDNTWIFNAGREVYELVNPGGQIHIMQSYSHQTDATLKIKDLPTLAARLQLPQGWSFRARKLTSELAIKADGTAVVIQDDLKNTYQLR